MIDEARVRGTRNYISEAYTSAIRRYVFRLIMEDIETIGERANITIDDARCGRGRERVMQLLHTDPATAFLLKRIAAHEKNSEAIVYDILRMYGLEQMEGAEYDLYMDCMREIVTMCAKFAEKIIIKRDYKRIYQIAEESPV